MFSVTNLAVDVIKRFLEDKDGPRSVRVMMMEGG